MTITFRDSPVIVDARVSRPNGGLMVRPVRSAHLTNDSNAATASLSRVAPESAITLGHVRTTTPSSRPSSRCHRSAATVSSAVLDVGSDARTWQVTVGPVACGSMVVLPAT
ncbi:hypothetical protein BRC94_00380 [Halobacteriales archaeon QS_5_70_17]|nr:MAG: hypothetical protein BRC94_00380 [Halobacteriales archaeon QS_5_70_17]